MTGYDDEMIDAMADDERPDDDDMPPQEPDPAAERMAAHLDAVDAAEDWTPGGDGDITPAIDPVVAMLARRWAKESNGAGELPADWIDGPVPF